MVVNDSKKVPKSSKIFFCELCDYSSCRKSQYTRHISTPKHQNKANGSKMVVKKFQKSSTPFLCECGKTYKYDSGYFRHKKDCKIETNNDSNLMEYLLKENQEMKNMVTEICNKLPNHQTNNNSTTNIFNINMFLNEQCKDAMNMTEFIESIQLTLEDIATIGEQGQTKGISNILISKLNDLDVFKRPMHCSDVKKEIIYVKDEDIWQEEKTCKPRIKNALDIITKKSIQNLSDVQQSPDDYLKTVSEVLKDPREDKKIISELVKEIYLKNL